jgi:hypothetical protein
MRAELALLKVLSGFPRGFGTGSGVGAALLSISLRSSKNVPHPPHPEAPGEADERQRGGLPSNIYIGLYWCSWRCVSLGMSVITDEVSLLTDCGSEERAWERN